MVYLPKLGFELQSKGGFTSFASAFGLAQLALTKMNILFICFQLVTSNESLEVQIQHIKGATSDEIGQALQEEITQVKAEKHALLQENGRLQE